MKVTTHILTAGENQITQRKTALKLSIQQTLARVSPLLPHPVEVDLVIYSNPEGAIPELGIGGFTPNAHTVFISVDPRHPKFASGIKTQLSRTLAHELHHAVRWTNPGYGHTLGEALVTEGLAAHFESEVFEGKLNMWDVAVRGKKLETLHNRAKKELHSPRYNHHDWFFGSRQRKIPRWSGYALAFHIISDYLQTHPSALPSKLVSTHASNFFL